METAALEERDTGSNRIDCDVIRLADLIQKPHRETNNG
jgi:hypothetical protein